SRGAEDLRHATGRTDALIALAREAVEVSVAGSDVAEQRGDADHGPVEILIEEADAPQHRPVGGPAEAPGGHETLALSGGCHLLLPWVLGSWCRTQGSLMREGAGGVSASLPTCGGGWQAASIATSP